MKKLRKYSLLVSMVALALVIMVGQFSDVVSACGGCTREMVVTSGTKDLVKIMGTRRARYKQAVETWVQPLWPTIEDAAWISSNYTVEDAENESWRSFIRIFCIPGGVVSASINITADNAYELYVNGKLVGSDGIVYGYVDDPQSWNWQSIEEYDLTSTLRSCLNCITVVVRNYEQDGGDWYHNPTGLIYRIHITYSTHHCKR